MTRPPFTPVRAGRLSRPPRYHRWPYIEWLVVLVLGIIVLWGIWTY